MELFRALAAVTTPPGPDRGPVDRALGLPPAGAGEHTDVFTLQLYPYASVYVGAEGMLGGEARDRVAGFWRALGAVPPAEPDHLAALLGLYADIGDAEADEPDSARATLLHRTRHALLWEHLLTWVPMYLARVADLAGPHHRRWARILSAALVAEAEALGPPQTTPLHLRAAPPPLDAPDDGKDDMLTGLLTPVRTGMILTRADLGRAARTLGLGLRMGERRFTLAALLAQDTPRMLGWLRTEARRAAERHRRLPAVLAPVSAFWDDRAEVTARVLDTIADECEQATRDQGIAV